MADAHLVHGNAPTPRGTRLWMKLADSWARACTIGQVTVDYPNGVTTTYTGTEPGPSARISVHNGRAVWRMLRRGDLGLAEGYMAGDWSTPDLTAVLDFGLRNETALAKQLEGKWYARIFSALRFRMQENTRRGARRNIAYHYDLGNDFYAEWLDATMTYSSAIFPAPETGLADAQRAKYQRIVDTLGIKPGDTVLEVGCGWGGFAEFAAREAGAKVTAITISEEQARYARERMVRSGVADRVEIRIEDYRDTKGAFDHIVSIEMLEAVGENNWPAYFRMIGERLAANGRALIQVITVPDASFSRYRRKVDFIQRYIFPGGMLLSESAMAENAARAALRLEDVHYFGRDYAETLRQWNVRFQASWPTAMKMGFDERFRRMWTYYLNSCEVCFALGRTDVGQFLIGKR